MSDHNILPPSLREYIEEINQTQNRLDELLEQASSSGLRVLDTEIEELNKIDSLVTGGYVVKDLQILKGGSNEGYKIILTVEQVLDPGTNLTRDKLITAINKDENHEKRKSLQQILNTMNEVPSSVYEMLKEKINHIERKYEIDIVLLVGPTIEI